MKFLYATLNIKIFFEYTKEVLIQDESTFQDKMYYLEKDYLMPVISGKVKNGKMIFEKSNDWIIAANKLKKDSLKIVVFFKDPSELSSFEKLHILTDMEKISDVDPSHFGESDEFTCQIFSFDKKLNKQDIRFIKMEVTNYSHKNIIKHMSINDNRLVVDVTLSKDFADKSSSNNFASFCAAVNSIVPIRSINGSLPRFINTQHGNGFIPK